MANKYINRNTFSVQPNYKLEYLRVRCLQIFRDVFREFMWITANLAWVCWNMWTLIANSTWYYQKIHGKQMLWENSIQAALNATTEINLYLKLFESSFPTVLIRDHCQRYHFKRDFKKFDETWEGSSNLTSGSMSKSGHAA